MLIRIITYETKWIDGKSIQMIRNIIETEATRTKRGYFNSNTCHWLNEALCDEKMNQVVIEKLSD